jgi:ribosomal protein L30E
MIKENIELSKESKKKLKIIAAEQEKTMRDLVLFEAAEIIGWDLNVEETVREPKETRTGLLINIPQESKDDIRLFSKNRKIRIRSFWNKAVANAIDRYS